MLALTSWHFKKEFVQRVTGNSGSHAVRASVNVVAGTVSGESAVSARVQVKGFLIPPSKA